MDPREIEEWQRFCDGESRYAPEHFSNLFMELFLEPLTAQEKTDLQIIFGLVPHSKRALERMLRLAMPAPSRPDPEIVNLVVRDLSEMRRVFTSPELLAAVDSAAIEITRDEDRFQLAGDSDSNRRFSYELAAFFMEAMKECDIRIRALSGAFYGIAANSHLQWALTADLLPIEIDFGNYVELYEIGVDYAICDSAIVVMNHRAKHEGFI